MGNNIDDKINVMIDGIKPYEYKKVIEELNKYYKNNYYKKLLKNLAGLESKPIYFEKYNEYVDQLVIEYSQCRKNIRVITLFPNAIGKNIDDKLAKNGSIYFVKKIKLTFREACSLIHQLYINTPYLKKIDEIEEKVKKCGWTKGQSGEIVVIVYELNKIGDLINFKKELREYIGGEIDRKSVLHINDTFLETKQYVELYFNKNSIDILKYQVLYRYLSPSNV